MAGYAELVVSYLGLSLTLMRHSMHRFWQAQKQMIGQERWVSMSSNVKGEIYEGLLQKNAEDVKSGTGQYFTLMVRCVRPEPMKTGG